MNGDALHPSLSDGFSLPDRLAPESVVARNWTKEDRESFYQSAEYEERMKLSWESKTKGAPFVWID